MVQREDVSILRLIRLIRLFKLRVAKAPRLRQHPGHRHHVLQAKVRLEVLVGAM